MVHLDVVRACNIALVKAQPLVAVFVGGTAGIGECGVRALAAAHAKEGKGLRVYIVGRKESAASKIIADCLAVCPTAQFQFVHAEDLSLLKDVDRVCADIVKAEEEANGTGGSARVDLLILTQGYLTFESRRETEEGLDTFMSISYYSRMRFIIQLLPLLTASSLSGRVVTVLNPKLAGKVIPEDLSLRDPKHYGFTNVSSHVVQMTTFFMENLAARNPDRLSLAHMYPGLVMTNGAETGRLPKWVKLLWRYVVAPVARYFAVSFEECGERVLFITSPRFPARSSDSSVKAPPIDDGVEIAVSSDGVVGGGAYSVDWDSETIPTSQAHEKARKEGLYEEVWEHTLKAFNDIEAGKLFTG